MTALKPKGRTLAEFEPLQPAEQKLLAACRAGEVAEISAQRPTAVTPDNTVRAAFLRFMLLGGDERAPVHEKGVLLAGAWITGELGMNDAVIPSSVSLLLCHFDTCPVFMGAAVQGSLNLTSSALPGFTADGLRCLGNLKLASVQSTAAVRLLGAEIGGQLDCENAQFQGETAPSNGRQSEALAMDSAVIKGDVLMEKFAAQGAVRLHGVQIAGNLECAGATFNGSDKTIALYVDGAVIKGSVNLHQSFQATGTVRLLGVEIAGDLNCQGASFSNKDGIAFAADGMDVQGAWFFRNGTTVQGRVSLSSAHVARLGDDKEVWKAVQGKLILNGFVYDSLIGAAPTDAAARIAWLGQQRQEDLGLGKNNRRFRPQPWRQLIKVLRDMGHAEDARQVSIAFEQHLRAANLIGQTPKDWNKFRAWAYRKTSRIAHRLFGVLTGYGYRPLRLLAWIVGVWLFCAGLYWCAALQGVFAPSDPLVFQNEKYAVCRPKNDDAPACAVIPSACAVVAPVKGAGNWYLCSALPEEYSGFSPLAYSLDVILPLVDLQQESSWSPLIPTPNKTWYKELITFAGGKHCTRLLVWFEILFGWLASLLLVAVVSGLTKRREE
jgi:hypothetical protein